MVRVMVRAKVTLYPLFLYRFRVRVREKVVVRANVTLSPLFLCISVSKLDPTLSRSSGSCTCWS